MTIARPISQRAREIAADAAVGPYGIDVRQIRQGTGDDLVIVQAVQAALDEPRAPMSTDEIKQRARRAAEHGHPGDLGITFTNGSTFRAAVALIVEQALHDLDKPVVDPAVLACREIVYADHVARGYHNTDRRRLDAGEFDDERLMKLAMTAYAAGQETRS